MFLRYLSLHRCTRKWKLERRIKMADTLTEQIIERELRRSIENARGVAYKFVSPGRSGVPDRIVILPGRVPIFVELKRAGGKTRIRQEKEIERLRRLGQDVRVVAGIKDLIAFLYDIGLDTEGWRVGVKYRDL